MSAHATRPNDRDDAEKDGQLPRTTAVLDGLPPNPTPSGLPPIRRTASITIAIGARIGPDSFDRRRRQPVPRRQRP